MWFSRKMTINDAQCQEDTDVGTGRPGDYYNPVQ